MQQDYNPSQATYEPKECGQTMIDAVAELAAKTGEDVASFQGRTMTEIFQLADASYDELPEFWRVWSEWHAPQPKPNTGDL